MTLFEKHYSVRKGAFLRSDPQKAGEYLDSLQQQQGKLNAKVLARAVEAAHNSGTPSPVDADFTWETERAVAKCHETEAAYLLRHIEVVVVDKTSHATVIPEPIRAFVNVVQAEKRGYVDVVTVLSDERLRKQLLKKAYDELVQWRLRYAQLAECAAIFESREVTQLRRESVLAS
jgi:hypothetical protein